MALGRFFAGRGLAKRWLNRAPSGVEHHAQDAVDAEPGVPEAGVSVDFTGHELRDRETATCC